MFRRFLLPCLSLLLLVPAQGSADELSISAGGVAVSSEYRDTKMHGYPMPLVSWENEHFYVKGLGAGGYLWKEGTYKLSMGLEYLPMHFKPHDSDNRAMRQLDKRYSSMLASAMWEYSSSAWGSMRLKASADVLDKSSGFLVDAAYSRTFDWGPFALTPTIGVLWSSEDYNDYYYGVSHGESQRSGLASYEAEDGFSPYASMRVDFALSSHWGLYVIASAMLLSEEMRDSPMVDEDVKYGFAGGINYRF